MENNESSKKNKITPWKIIRAIIIIALVIVIAYEGVMIYRDQTEYAVAVNEYDELSQTYVKIEEDADESQKNTTDDNTYPKLDIDFAALKEKNPDFIGWLYFPAFSEINYPVVKEQKVDQYLYKTFDGTSNKAG